MAFTEIDEKVLVRAYQAGDERAFDTIVRTQYNALYAHALKRLSQHEAAEDAVQDTLLRAYRALPNLDGDLALRAWLHRILTNVCHDEGNRRRRAQGLVDKLEALPEELAPDPIDDTVLHETVRVMSEALADLPESYREALVLRYVDGLSFREVAEATGVSEENARARVHRGRLALHKVMSRLAVMAAFIIPGLKRVQHATETSAAAASAPAPETVNLATQLTSHVVTAAPTVSRLADVAASFGPAKAAVAAAAVTAVAAVGVPAAVHQIDESPKTPDRPAAVAAPAPEQKALTSTPTTVKAGATTTSSTLPESLARPFADAPAAVANSTTTSAPGKSGATTTTTTTAAPVDSSPQVSGHLQSTDFTVDGAAPQWDVQGHINVTVDGKTSTGTIGGRIFVYDDGTAESDDLALVIGDSTGSLRFRGKATPRPDRNGYDITGIYSFTGASSFGLAPKGNLTSAFGIDGKGGGSLTLDVRGRAS